MRTALSGLPEDALERRYRVGGTSMGRRLDAEVESGLPDAGALLLLIHGRLAPEPARCGPLLVRRTVGASHRAGRR